MRTFRSGAHILCGMARLARVVIPGCAHHVTQRGNHRQDVFYCDHDRKTYLAILRDHCERLHLRVAAWCLMSNHVHLVMIPEQEDSLARAVGRTHYEYACWLHVRQRQVGHLWQNRFYSCPLADDHLWEAIRYNELNPVRAGLVKDAVEWRWSSARAHVEGKDDWNLTDLTWWGDTWRSGPWEEALVAGLASVELAERLREATRTGRPFGSTEFAKELEKQTGRQLLELKRGPKPRVKEAGLQMSFGNP